MNKCIAYECEETAGVLFRNIVVYGIRLRHVPLCREHYNELGEAQARASWGANY